MRTILITGASGNLGGLLARHLAGGDHHLRLMLHRTPVSTDLRAASNVRVVPADLARPETLAPAVEGVDTVVHFAGVLFAPRPEKFLPVTNTRWFSNLLDACIEARVGRVILIAFPHVEGPTTPAQPAAGRLDGHPVSVHARTRGEEERLLFHRTQGTQTTPVSLRLGMVYGRGILMVDTARWLARHRLLGVWKEPTWIHLISTPDYLAATAAAAVNDGVQGIYHAGDECPVTLQDFLDQACDVWGVPRPWRMPLWMIRAAAGCCEIFAAAFRTRAPLTRDFIKIGRVSYCGDTRRFRQELLPRLTYATLRAGHETLR
ncbi:MAG: NAD(P)H-binding protein [Acidobacteria bacterium]|nr:NAD(P)H-binding protein [Acidobacteriota bacterium]